RTVSGASRAPGLDDGEDAVVPFEQQLADLRLD
ncbi:oxidoreductase, partial [Streptomyces sp. SID8455]|nr:oxidoreductase [Streptomyces sp. SID8455]